MRMQEHYTAPSSEKIRTKRKTGPNFYRRRGALFPGKVCMQSMTVQTFANATNYNFPRSPRLNRFHSLQSCHRGLEGLQISCQRLILVSQRADFGFSLLQLPVEPLDCGQG